MSKIRIAIIGYGNLGRGVEKAIAKNEDMCLAGIFTRRDPGTLGTKSPAYALDELDRFVGQIDVCILCGGSATDILTQGPEIARRFHFVDAYDNHSKIPEYYEMMNTAGKVGRHVGIISTGWDPGLFSMQRMLAEAVLPDGHTYTFWGRGVSQGHSDAIRRIPGVIGATQYTVPNESVIQQIREGQCDDYSAREKHARECYVAVESGADEEAIRQAIVTMPDYFSDYDTTVHFVSQDELKANHSGMPHGGKVMRIGETSECTQQTIEFDLSLQSNPEFTASVNVAFARAVARLADEGQVGARTVLDIPLSYLSKRSSEELRKTII